MPLSRRPSRRELLAAACAAPVWLAVPALAAPAAFDRWVAAFRPRALARGVSQVTYDRHGCVLDREGGRHSIFVNPSNGRKAPIPRHSEIDNR